MTVTIRQAAQPDWAWSMLVPFLSGDVLSAGMDDVLGSVRAACDRTLPVFGASKQEATRPAGADYRYQLG
jgi:hypothetical protein